MELDIEEIGLNLYDKVYGICDKYGIVRLARKTILKPKAVKRSRPTHDLLCECRRCKPSVTTYWRKMKSISVE